MVTNKRHISNVQKAEPGIEDKTSVPDSVDNADLLNGLILFSSKTIKTLSDMVISGQLNQEEYKFYSGKIQGIMTVLNELAEQVKKFSYELDDED